MNPIYRAILEHVRENSAILTLHTDDDAIVQMFANHRGERGLRLTKFGLQTMQRVFVSYDVDLPADEVLLPKHLVALDKLAKTPYYFDRKHVVVFDHTIAVTLKLVGGRLSKLIDIES